MAWALGTTLPEREETVGALEAVRAEIAAMELVPGEEEELQARRESAKGMNGAQNSPCVPF